MKRYKVQDINLWEANYRRGDVSMICQSIQRFGYNRGVAIWRDNVVIAGNHTIKALQKLENDQADPPVNVHVDNGEWFIDAHDVSHLSDKEAEAYAIADNRSSDVATNDNEQLANLLSQLANDNPALLNASGFSDAELDYLMQGLVHADSDDWSSAFGNLPDSDRQPFQQMTFTLHDSQVDLIKDALKKANQVCDFSGYANENSNGNGLAAICEAFLNG